MLEIEEDRIIVPKGIRYISNWKDYNLSDFNFPHILDKKIPGCGYTEYCITSNLNVILCSPRKILLENKEEQHPDTVFYFKNELEDNIEVDKDITREGKSEAEIAEEKLEEKKRELQRKLEEMIQKLNDYLSRCIYNDIPAKVLVTYDSFRLVKKLLIDRGIFDTFYVVIDEMQSVFSDALFKSDTELSFVDQLQGLQKVCYVSATPMLKKYLAMLDEFKDLPYYELDWKKRDPLRVVTPDLKARVTQSIVGTAERIIQTYKKGEFKEMDTMIDGRIVTVQSKEAVIYVNSVKNIIDIIKKTELTPDECNILCANTTRNQARIKKRLGAGFIIGKVPLKGQPHKMFTFCTRTVYLGADFYSTCARSFILSDANIKTLVVDITLDLPQILGRQRLECNPWRNRAELYYKTLTPGRKMSEKEFKAILDKKLEETKSLLRTYGIALDEDKHNVAKNYLFIAKTGNYKDNYVAVNIHNGGDLIPVFNNLVWVAEQRAFEIEQIDYESWYTVFNSMMESSLGDSSSDENIQSFFRGFEELPDFCSRMRAVCESPLTELERSYVLVKLPIEYRKYYETIGPDRLKSLGYNITNIKKEIKDLKIDMDSLSKKIFSNFKEGQRYTKADIKTTLGEIYESLEYSRTPKASDLEYYFKIKDCLIQNKETGKRDKGFEIIKKKDV
jgi:hypothetical protein